MSKEHIELQIENLVDQFDTAVMELDQHEYLNEIPDIRLQQITDLAEVSELPEDVFDLYDDVISILTILVTDFETENDIWTETLLGSDHVLGLDEDEEEGVVIIKTTVGVFVIGAEIDDDEEEGEIEEEEDNEEESDND